MRRPFLLSILSALTFLAGCIQTENSSSLDSDLYGGVTGSPEFLAARAVLSQSCNGCHIYHTMSEAQMITIGVVVPGNPEDSQIYYRLAGSTGPNGPKNMPTGSTLSVADRATISTWIQGIAP